MALRGWFNDIVELGRGEIERRASADLNTLGQDAHIRAQQQVVSDFETFALTPFRSGLLSPQNAIDKINQLNLGFTQYAQRLGYNRALAGARDVNTLAIQLINDIHAKSPSVPGGGMYLPTGLPGSLAGMDYSTLALIAVAAYLLMRRK